MSKEELKKMLAQLAELSNEKEVEKIADLLQVYFDDPDSFKKMCSEKDIKKLLKEFL